MITMSPRSTAGHQSAASFIAFPPGRSISPGTGRSERDEDGEQECSTAHMMSVTYVP